MADLVSCGLVAVALVGLVFGIVHQRSQPAIPPATRKACGGDDYLDTTDPWRCIAFWCEGRTVHRCAASYDHTEYDPGSDHVDYLGHRWPQKPRRSWYRAGRRHR